MMRRTLLLCLLTVAAFLTGRAQSGYALLMEDGGSLSVRNNVVVNNGNTPSNVTATDNLFGQYPLFANNHTDFHIVMPSLVYNLGDNTYATWLYDLNGILRKYNDTVDLGAFEYPYFVNYAVFQDIEGTLTFCNNIIINNFSGDNVNAALSSNNYLADGSGVFLNDHLNFHPKSDAPAVNAGSNSCAGNISTDISGHARVQHDTVDIGAFETRYVEDQFPVFQETDGNLTFCNNIIINNHADSNVNVVVTAFNLVANSDQVFLHPYANFCVQSHSVTVDAGNNNCASTIATDLTGEGRVMNYTVDLGAFEIRYDRAYYPVFKEGTGDLHFCNNIIMNNHADTNINVAVEANNFLTDSAEVFLNPYINFRPKAQSPIIDAGQNTCASGIANDLNGEDRVLSGTIDIGAYEYRPPVVNYPVLKEGTAVLHFCNNIIINNYADSNVNVTVDDNNLVQNGSDVFVGDLTLFMLADSSVAIDAGSNICMSDTLDLAGAPRVENEVIDIGAFERRFWPRQFGIYQEENGNLTFCNNILSNNHSVDSNVNVATGPHNLTVDNDYVFVDKYQNYKLLDGSVAVDAGSNPCCTWAFDLVDTTRVLHEVIDLGAFEIYIDNQRAVVYQDSGTTLNLCNNVIILNSPHAPNVNFSPVPESNIVNDLVEVFRDELLDFRLTMHSDAVDAGDNGCNGLPTDIDTVTRISGGRIDIGAFENPVYYDTNYAGGGGGGGGWGGGGGDGGGYMDPDYNGIVCERTSASLYLCNNIIVNNRFAANTNTWFGFDTAYCNLIQDTVAIFRDANHDFRLIEVSPAVNRGRNDCNELPEDIAKRDRIIQDTIDIGAFEFWPEPQYVAVFQEENHQMTVCNNIIINNIRSFSVNDMNTPGNNLLIDNNQVFRDNELNYMPRPTSAAVNQGNNDCCPLATDLKDGARIYMDIIDIGAYEITHFSDSDIFVVYGREGHQLNLCNNIIINNSGTNPVSDDEVSAFNLLVDHHDVFRDNVLDYTPRENSIVINVGNNDCCLLGLDMADVGRIYQDTIDFGAFEQSTTEEDSVVAVLQKENHTLTLCNNIIVNNPNAVSTNAQVDAGHNILSAGEDLFVHSTYDYTPRSNSAAVNAGDNTCCTLASDLCEKTRVYENVIDIGAFEPRVEYDTAIAFLGDETGTDWTLCNNIIINNKYSNNLNISNIPANNIVVDNDTLFVDNDYNYRLRPTSIAVNAGSNACVGWGSDMEDNIRIYEEIVDIGAFEQYIDTQKLTTVLTLDTDALVLCNNIIANNKYSQDINLDEVPVYNIVGVHDTLFVDRRFDYRPRPNSPAVNQGNNDCASWSKDMVTKDRVFAEVIDIGAYELRSHDTVELYAVNGDDFCGGSNEGGSGGGSGGGDPGGGGGSGGGSGTDTTGTGGNDSITNALKLRMYNNIVIYNPGHALNVGGNIIGDHNLWDDTPGVFTNDADDYTLTAQSPAVDAGDNQWVSWPTDLKDDPRIACGNIVDQGAYEVTFETLNTTVYALEVPTDNCQGYYIQLTATPGAQHYYWSHSNEDTNVVQVSPLLPTEYTVIASNGGECVDTASVYVIPSSMLSDSLGSPASVGKTFWLSYLRNHFHTPTITLNISAEEACTGTVSNPRTSWSMPFAVADHSVTTVTIPVSQAYPQVADVAGDFGLLVETTDSVSVYAANYNTSSFDVTDVLPVEALSDEYVLQTYMPMMNAEFVIVATVDNTEVDITPSRALQGGHPAQQTFTVTLQAGQTYLGLSQYGGTLGDLSGTLIQSHDNKPVAVFNGNVCALVPIDNSYSDHLVEQAIGVKYWGRNFAITSTESQNFDVVRVTALRDNTEIRKNGTLLATIQSRQTYEFQLPGNEGSCYLETSEPVGVYLYIAGAVQGNPQERSDPSMVWIPPTEQMLNDISFVTFNSPGITDHYVNIVVPAAETSGVTLDGVNIGGQFAPVVGNTSYAFVRRHIANGTHTLHCDGGFIAHCYGLGFHESYGYAAGSKAVPLKEQLYVNGILNTDLPPGTKFCPYEPINFNVEVNYPCDSVVWNFGDSTPTVTGMQAVHSYAESGTYTVAATLYITSNGAVFCSNLYARIRVVEGPTITYYDSICQGQDYLGYGFEVLTPAAGHHTFTRSANSESSYCDSTYVLELEVRENYRIIEDTICVNNHYTTYGFDITPTETGLYQDTIMAGHDSYGCDSLVILQLSVTPNTDNPPAIEGEGWPCQGGEYTYTIDSLAGLQNVVWTVPDSLIVLPGEDPYSITLLFGVYADSMDICVTATGGCGELNWCRTLYPQEYSYVQIYDTLCANITEYNRFGFELTNVSDSNDLFIRHDTAAGGCDSTTVLRLVFLPVYEVADTIGVCVNDFPYLYHDTLLADTGTHLITLPTVDGCDSVVHLTLAGMPVASSVYEVEVCDSLTWIDGVTYYESNDTSRYYLTAVNGCDSVVTLHLTVNHSTFTDTSLTLCENDLPYHYVNGLIDTTFGVGTPAWSVIQYPFATVHGCDSLVTLTLTVHAATADTLTITILENNLPYHLNDSVYNGEGTYTQLLTNAAGCDSTLTVVLNVLSNVTNAADSTICEGVLPFTWNGVTFMQADTLVATLTASTGADSLVVMNVSVVPTTYGTFDTTIVENALPCQYNDISYFEAGIYTQYLTNAAGCDSLLTITLTVFPNVAAEIDSTVCEGELPVIWNDSIINAAGTITTTVPAHTGADSTITMTLTVIPTTYGTLDTAVIENALPYQHNEISYVEAGTYTQLLVNSAGCDSILTVNLNVFPNVTSELDSAVCETAFPFAWNDSVFTAAGTKTTTIFAHTGADSTITMTVTMIPTSYGSFDTAIVENALPYQYNDSTYIEEGIYIQHLTNAAGCDSILTLTLVVFPNVTSEIDSTVCEGELPITWNDSIFTVAGTKTTTILAHTGADSTITMNLTVLPTTYGTFDTAVVENALPYQYNDSTYVEAGTYTQYLTNAAGCDSILTLSLTVYPNVTNYLDSVVCEGGFPITWNGVVFAAAGIDSVLLQAATGADSVVVMTVTESSTTYGTVTLAVIENALPYPYNDSTYAGAGTYTQYLTNAAGCDSVLTVVINVYENVTTFVDSVVCEGELPITWNDSVFTAAGMKSTTILSAEGADSTVVMTLTVTPTTYGTFDTAVIENALPYQYNDSTYVEAGIYTQLLTNAAGCDSILTLHLGVIVELDSAVCETAFPFTWNDSVFTEADTKVSTILSHTGADSAITMTVTMLPTTYGTFDTLVNVNVLPYQYNDSTYVEAGIYTQYLTNAAGCDSVLTLQINVMVEVDSIVCEGGFPITWNGVTFAAAGTDSVLLQAATGADSVVVMMVTESPTTYGTVTLAVVENALPYHYNDSTYVEAGTYTQYLTNAAGCDSVLTLTLTVFPNVTSELDSAVCETAFPFTWNDSVFTVAGTKTTTILAHTGADSTITMTVTMIPTTYGTFDTAIVENALPYHYNDSTYVEAGTYTQYLTNAAGCDSILTLTLTVFPNVTSEIDSIVCEDELPVLWNDSIFNAAGTKTTTIPAHTGADSTITMNLTVIPTTYGTLDTAVIENALPYHYNDSTYAEAGTYTQYLTNAAGCDSILTLTLTVFSNVASELDSAVCETAFPFTWNDSVFTAAGTKTTLVPAHTGADSTITMTVTVLPITYGTFDTAIVENALPYHCNDSTYAEAGTYTQYLTNAAGCDSILTLTLAVYFNVTGEDDSTICASELPLLWNGVTFTQAGTQTATLTAATGADSVVTMTLHVNALSYTTIDTAVIENALPCHYNDSTYAEAGTYTQYFTNALGCDSILTIHLTVYQNVTTTVDTTVCAADLPYTWHGHSFTAAGTHVVTLLTSHGADSVVTYHLSVDNISANIGNVTHITCYGESTGSATATVTGGQTPMTYAWTNASGTNIATTTSINNRPAGTYTFTVTDHIGCTATASVTLNTLNGELTPGTIAASQEVCDGEDIAPFTGTAASGGNNGGYQWQISTNGTDWAPAPGTANAQGYTYPNTAAYAFSLRRAWVSQSCGTVYSNIVTVNVWPNSVDTVTASICQGETYTEYNFDVTADQTAEAGDYTFEQHHATGHCDSMVVLLLTVNPVVAELVEATVCEGEGYNANGFTISPQETIGAGELIRVQNLQTVNGCDSVVTLQLTIIDTALRIEMLTEDFCEYNEASLTVLSPMPDYVWSTGETATTIVVTSPGIYSVTATEGGCSATAHIRVEGCHYELVLPNAITPSRGDGLNDCFYIPEGFTTNINLFKVYIYNRWGELVFYSTDKNFRWYGEYRGQTQYQTIYNYVIEYTDTAGRPQKLVGSITVL
jgi:gliding motility-associated-like protein